MKSLDDLQCYDLSDHYIIDIIIIRLIEIIIF